MSEMQNEEMNLGDVLTENPAENEEVNVEAEDEEVNGENGQENVEDEKLPYNPNRKDAQRVDPEVRKANQAEGTRRSWQNEDVRVKRTTRRACTVKMDGKDEEPMYFSSVAAAFQHFGFTIGDHHKLRAELRAEEGNVINYDFAPANPLVGGAEAGTYIFTDVDVRPVEKKEKAKKEKKEKVEGEAEVKPKKPRKPRKSKKEVEEPVDAPPAETVEVEPNFD